MKTSRRPLLWYNPVNHYVYEWGGWTYNGNSGSNENWYWTFQPDGHGGSQWNQNPIPVADGTTLTDTFGASFVSSPKAFYGLGGTLIPDVVNGNELPPNVSVPGLLAFDFSDNTWTNKSSTGLAQAGYNVLGEACFVPNFGQEGLLVFLGGDSPPNDTYYYESAPAVADMATITLYDIHTDLRYQQATTGDVPPGREGFCAVGAPAADNSSYEISIYGGYSNSSEDSSDSAFADFEAVYILSLPAFHWFRAASGTRRAYHTCQLIGKRQMISIGGQLIESNPTRRVGAEVSDPWTKGIGIFDITDLSWSSSFNPDAMPYESPGVVKQHYQSKPDPPTWSNSSLAAIFTTKASSNSSSAPSPPPKSNGTNVGAIAGGTIGGVAALCVALVLAAFVLRKQRQGRNAHQAPSHSGQDNIIYTPMQEMSAASKPGEIDSTPTHELGAHSAYGGADPYVRSELDG
ncbi:hypothetical protein ACLMJK_007634 [Lecanora helva]